MFFNYVHTTSLIARHLNSKFKIRNCEIWLLKKDAYILDTKNKNITASHKLLKFRRKISDLQLWVGKIVVFLLFFQQF